MQAEKQEAWRLCVDAKAKNFVFKLKATIPFSPNFKIFPFSILLKLSPSDLIKVKYQPHVYFPRKQTSFKSKFLRVLEKLRIRSSKNKAIAAKNSSNLERAKRWFLCEGQIWLSSMVFGSLALLIYQEKDQKGIMMMHSYSWVLLLYLLASPLMKKLLGRKTCNCKVLVMVIINVTMVGGCVLLNNYLRAAGYASRSNISKAFNYSACFTGNLFGASKIYRRRPHKQDITGSIVDVGTSSLLFSFPFFIAQIHPKQKALYNITRRLLRHIWSLYILHMLIYVTFLYFSSIFMAR